MTELVFDSMGCTMSRPQSAVQHSSEVNVGSSGGRLLQFLCLFALLCALGVGQGHAADIILSKQSNCAIELSGTIEEGDAAKLLKLLQLEGMIYDGGEGNDYRTKALCLDSDGGNFLGGIALARIVYEQGVPTRLLPGSECYSSCAFVFMAGRSLGYEWDEPYRGMSKNAKLGFHAPFTTFSPGEPVLGKDVNTLVSAYNAVIGDFIQFGQSMSIFSHRPNFSQNLLGELLRMGPDEMLTVETIEDAERWQINLEEVEVSPSFDPLSVANACENFQAWVSDRASESVDGYTPSVRPVELQGEEGAKVYLHVDTGGMEERYCLVALAKGGGGYEICSVNGFNGANFGRCPAYGIYVPGYYGLRADTPISALP